MKNTIPIGILVVMAASIFSCSLFRPNTMLSSPESLTIAIAPCEVIPVDRPLIATTFASSQQHNRAVGQILQFEVFKRLFALLEDKPQYQVVLQHLDDTNNMLAAKGISAKASWQMPHVELAQLLGVDAVLRVTMQEDPGNVRRIIGSYDLEGAPNDDNGLAIEASRTAVTAGLYDGLAGLPLWTIGKPEPVERGPDKRVVANYLVRKLKRRLPK